jgi:hypothetical protein
MPLPVPGVQSMKDRYSITIGNTLRAGAQVRRTPAALKPFS